MAVRIPQYQQQTSPGGLGVVPTARAPQLDDAGSRATARLANAIGNAAGTLLAVDDHVRAEKERQEAEDAKVWTAKAVADAQVAMASSFAESQDAAGDGAADFTEKFASLFDEYQNDALGNAPNEVSKKFYSEAMLRLRTDMVGKALQFETAERRNWRVNTGKAAIDAVAAHAAADPSRLPVVLAEQRALIDSYDVPAESRRAMRDYLDAQVSTAAVLGEIERDPGTAIEMLSRRLGVAASAIVPPNLPGSAREIQSKFEQIGRSFGFETTSTTRSEGENKRVGGVSNSQHLESRGTARDWSVKGKSPEEVAAFAAALRAEGFEVITKNHGTGPHVHAELPPEGKGKKGPTLNEAVARGKTETTGAMAYDMLTVPQVVQLLGRATSEREKQGTQFRSYIAGREADDLAAFGDGKQPTDPLGPSDFIEAFGGVEGARRWQGYQHAQQFASEVVGLSTKTPAEIASTLKGREPSADAPGYAMAARAHGALVQAANHVMTQRAADPMAYAMGAGLATAEPLNFQDAEAMGAELKNRIGVAETMAQKYGTAYTLLTKDEIGAMSGMMGGMTAPEKAQFLQTVRTSLPDPRAYQSIMGQLRPDSPVTATAGSIMYVGGQVEVSAGGMFSQGQTLRADQVAQRVLMGEDLLNPTKGAKGQDGKPKFPMPSETDLRALWSDYTGPAYAGSPDTEAASYQAFRAFYAAEVASSGDYSGEFSEDVARRAAAAVTGGVADVNGSAIVLPWGVNENFAVDSLRRDWEAQRTAAGLDQVPFEQIGLMTVGDGLYAVTAGTGPVRGRDGRPLYLRAKRVMTSDTPLPPTSM